MQGLPLKILAFEVNRAGRVCKPYFKTIKDDLKDLQSFVGGYIQIVHFSDDIDIVCCDEGKLIGQPPNRVWVGKDRDEIYDLLVGNFFLCRHDGAELDDIREEDLEIALKHFLPVYSINGSCITLLPEELQKIANPTKEELEKLYPPKTKLILFENLDDKYTPIMKNSVAEVQFIDDALNIHVSWVGQKTSLSIIYDLDLFFRVSDLEEKYGRVSL